MILFVDDEPRIMDSYLQYLKAKLAPLKYEVVFISDIDKAVEFFDQNHDKIDLAILDIMMPPGKFSTEQTNGGLKTGLAFYEKIRLQSPNMPIIVFTNFFDHEVDARFKQDSNCRFLQKVNYLLDDFVVEVKKALSLPTTEDTK